MAKILDQEEQRKALKNITTSIKDLEAANDFLKAKNPSGIYTIAFTDEEGKKCSTTIHAGSKGDIDSLIMTHKEEEKNRITKLAQDNRIALDPEDHEIMDYMIS